MKTFQFGATCFLAVALALTSCQLLAANQPESGNLTNASEVRQIQDECAIAAKHYVVEDLPDEDIVELFQQLAKKGDVRGTMWIARLYHKGRCSLPISPEIAQKMAKDVIADVEKLAEKGDVEAQFLLGAAYQEGLALQQNATNAVKWFTKATDSGQISAMNNLGVMIANALGTEPDIVRARALLQRAAELGSQLSARTLSKYSSSGRDDTERLKTLRKSYLVQALGMQKERGIGFLVEHGLITDPNGYIVSDYQGVKGQTQYLFKKDGIAFNFYDLNNRINNVEAYVKGFRDSEQFRGEMPFGFVWVETSINSVQEVLGNPDDSGRVEIDQAHGMAYWFENVSFAVMFSYEGKRELKVWRAFERWAATYPN